MSPSRPLPSLFDLFYISGSAFKEMRYRLSFASYMAPLRFSSCRISLTAPYLFCSRTKRGATADIAEQPAVKKAKSRKYVCIAQGVIAR